MTTFISIGLLAFYLAAVVLLVMDWRRTRELRRQQQLLIDRTYELHRAYQMHLDQTTSRADYEAEHLDKS